MIQDEHQLDFQGDVSEPLVRKMVDRLGRAIASEEMRNRMDLEDEIDGIFERALGKKDKIIAEKDLEILIEKQNAENERQKNEALLKEIEELRKQLKK